MPPTGPSSGRATRSCSSSIADGRITHAPRSRFVDFLRPGDLVIANDAATLPASLHGVHLPSGADDRSAARRARVARGRATVHVFSAVVFGAGDFRTRTEDRPLPPHARAGRSSGARAARRRPSRRCSIIRGWCRCASTVRRDEVWAGLARHGRPIQYAHVPTPLALWDVWTPIAGVPVAFEPPSAGFALDWATIRAMRERGIAFATITLAAGISSTGDPGARSAASVRRAVSRFPMRRRRPFAARDRDGGRIVAVGTTVVRALEHAARRDGVVRAGRGHRGPAHWARPAGCASSTRSSRARTNPAAATTSCCVRSSTTPRWPRRARRSRRWGYRTHEFGDSVLIEKDWRRVRRARGRAARCSGYWPSNKPSTLPSVSAMRA